MAKKKTVAAPGRRRVFTAEYKLEMVRQFEVRRAQGASQAQIARELDLSVPMLQSWVRRSPHLRSNHYVRLGEEGSCRLLSNVAANSVGVRFPCAPCRRPVL